MCNTQVFFTIFIKYLDSFHAADSYILRLLTIFKVVFVVRKVIMDEVIPGLWLGSRPDFSIIPTLHRNGIKAILTVELQPLPLPTFYPFKRLYIHASDEPYENLLKSFEKSITFIEENIKGGVLVHW